MKQLAIIIPAYKETFLRKALESIASQTCKDFTLYIGDDCSPYDLKSIVSDFTDKIDIVYKRFDTNLGGKDLVAQWERCVNLSKAEPYIWLFSDDDIMDPRCVEMFFKHLKVTNGAFDLYHFDVKVINDNDKVTRIPQPYPQNLDSYTYYKYKLRSKIASLVVENIFSRKIYNSSGGFVNFDLAWGSDTATWVLFSNDKGFCTIPNAYVLWRNGSENITPNTSSKIVERKERARVEFFKWSKDFFDLNGKNVLLINIRCFISRLTLNRNYISNDFCKQIVKDFCKSQKCMYMYPLLYLIIKYRKV